MAKSQFEMEMEENQKLNELLAQVLVDENQDIVSHLAELGFSPKTFGYGRYGEGKLPLLFGRKHFNRILTDNDLVSFTETFNVTATLTGEFLIVAFN